MSIDSGFLRSCCGRHHDELPLSYHMPAPAHWSPEMTGAPDSALSPELPVYEPTTLNLKTNLHTRPVGPRPVVELEPTGHPLAVEQRTGIAHARVRELAELLLHPGQHN
ncbi:DUF2199 domain-containing protein [Microbispora bryophytorum]|uniref:DUF2199 domain-containing protein n=1 Tax=Microbispora bryophytorum TaxID=1460882 RepID=UPI0033C9D3D3